MISIEPLYIPYSNPINQSSKVIEASYELMLIKKNKSTKLNDNRVIPKVDTMTCQESSFEYEAETLV
jgi:hypothetical protein